MSKGKCSAVAEWLSDRAGGNMTGNMWQVRRPSEAIPYDVNEALDRNVRVYCHSYTDGIPPFLAILCHFSTITIGPKTVSLICKMCLGIACNMNKRIPCWTA